MTKVTIDRALIEQAIEALANVEVAGPDDDGVIWINLPGNGVTGKAILRVGKSGLIAAQCATLFDEQRVGAIAALRAILAEPAVEPVAWIKTSDQHPPEGVRVFWFNPQYNQVGYDTWMGSDYKFTAEYWMHIPGTAPKAQAVKSVNPRHPVVVKWRNDGIEACAGIADAYGNADAARDMRALFTSPPPPAEPAPVPLLSDDEIDDVRTIALEANEFPTVFARAIEQLVRRKAGL